jgi:hypothetical protein
MVLSISIKAPVHRTKEPRMPNRISFQLFRRAALLQMMVLFAGAGLHAASHAQPLFKCGKTYQDRPCEGGESTKLNVGSSGSSRPAAAGAAHPACAQRGERAIKIVWGREGGLTLDQALNQASGRDKELVSAVYRVRGSTQEVRTRIEAECMAELEQKARFQALVEATRPPGAAFVPAAAFPAPGADVKPSENSGNADAADKAAKASAAASEAAAKKNRCNSLSAEMESIRAAQRAGGSASTMDSLNRNARNAEKKMGDAGCR